MYTRAVSFACDGRAASPYGRRIARFQPPAPIKHNVDTIRLAPRQTRPINYFGVSFILLLTRVSQPASLETSNGRTLSQTATATRLDLKPADTKNLVGANIVERLIAAYRKMPSVSNRHKLAVYLDRHMMAVCMATPEEIVFLRTHGFI
jgi:hypothetical protein